LYTLPDGSKSRFKFEDKPILKTIDREVRIENM